MNSSTTGQLSLGRQLFTSLMIMIQALKGGILFVLLSLTLCITALERREQSSQSKQSSAKTWIPFLYLVTRLQIEE